MLKIKDGFLLKEIAGDYMVVPVGDNLVDFNALIALNDTGAYLWEQLKDDKTQEQLADALLKEYDVDRASAISDVNEFIDSLRKHDLVV